MTRRSRWFGVATLMAGLFAGCGDGDDRAGSAASPDTASESSTTQSPSTSAEKTDPLIRDLCGVLNAALGGETELARSTFDHGPLHTLADEILDADRAVAARLLVAKEAVEADLADPDTEAATIAADLEALVQATAEALAVNGSNGPSDCQEFP